MLWRIFQPHSVKCLPKLWTTHNGANYLLTPLHEAPTTHTSWTVMVWSTSNHTVWSAYQNYEPHITVWRSTKHTSWTVMVRSIFPPHSVKCLPTTQHAWTVTVWRSTKHTSWTVMVWSIFQPHSVKCLPTTQHSWTVTVWRYTNHTAWTITVWISTNHTAWTVMVWSIFQPHSVKCLPKLWTTHSGVNYLLTAQYEM